MLICGQFIAKDENLWSTLLFVCFEKLNFSDFWGPLNLLGNSKKSQLLDSWPLSMPLKTRPWMNLFKNIVLYLVLCTSKIPGLIGLTAWNSTNEDTLLLIRLLGEWGHWRNIYLVWERLSVLEYMHSGSD